MAERATGPEGENFDLKGAMTIPIRQIPRF
jgi:hypothetical protein